ncbi:MAG: inositol-phosphate phosphatase [Xanthomonadales bacterium]|nr:inositol-phosphate phosphatase [Xanthomonadales bacterium]
MNPKLKKTSANSYYPYLQTALKASRAASKIASHYYQLAQSDSLAIEIKSDQSPVTVADREAETAIRNIILGDWPEHDIYGEEHGRIHADSDFLWLVDPIDGTKSFVRGYGFFSVQIALMLKGKLVLGVSCAPVMNELAWALRGEGAYLNDKAIQVSDISALEESTVSTGNLSSIATSSSWQALGEVLSGCGKTRGYGDFYHYHRLAAGQLEIVIESDLNILDIAALTIIIEEAGGQVSDLHGQPVNLNTSSLLASNGKSHNQLLKRLDY